MNGKTMIAGIVIFSAGAAAGMLGAMAYFKEKYRRISEEEIEDVKTHYECKLKNTLANAVDAKPVADTRGEQAKSANIINPANSALTRSSLDEATFMPRMVRTSYNDIAKEKLKQQISHGRQADEVVTDAAGMIEGEYEEVYGVHGAPHIDRTEPYVISDVDFSEGRPDHDKVSLYYYAHDDVLCNEDEEIIDDIDGTVGNEWLDAFENSVSVWVRNENLGTDYEICAINGSYAQLVHGIGVNENLSPRERYARRSEGVYDE